jgi:hypothetical protein
VRGCGESRPRCLGLFPGSAHSHTNLLGFCLLPLFLCHQPARSLGSNIGQPDHWKTRIKTSAHVGSRSRECHVTMRSGPQLPLPPPVQQKPTLPLPSLHISSVAHFPLCQSQGPQKSLLLVVGIFLSLINTNKLHLLPHPLTFYSSSRNNFASFLLQVQLLFLHIFITFSYKVQIFPLYPHTK